MPRVARKWEGISPLGRILHHGKNTGKIKMAMLHPFIFGDGTRRRTFPNEKFGKLREHEQAVLTASGDES
jgi:hypothetical protein